MTFLNYKSLLFFAYLLIFEVNNVYSQKINIVIISRQLKKDVNADNRQVVYGIMDTNGKILIKPQFFDINNIGLGLIAVKEYPQGKWFIYNYEGKKKTYNGYDEISYFTFDSLANIKQNNLWGVIDINLKEIVKPQYEHIGLYRNGLASVVFGDKYGYLDKLGNLKINPIFNVYKEFNEPLSDLTEFSNGFAVISKNGKFGFIDSDGKVSILPKFDYVRKFNSTFCIVGNYISKNNDYDNKDKQLDFYKQLDFFLIDKNGKQIGEKKFCKIGRSKEGLIAAVESKYKDNGYVDENTKIGFINTKGEWVIQPQYPQNRSINHRNGLYSFFFNNGYAFVPKSKDAIGNLTYNFVDKSGVFISDEKYYEVSNTFQEFSNGMAVVSLSEEYKNLNITNLETNITSVDPMYSGYIDTQGKFVIPPRFRTCNTFYFNIAEVSGNRDCQNRGSCFIDKKGNYVYYDHNATLPLNYRLVEKK